MHKLKINVQMLYITFSTSLFLFQYCPCINELTIIYIYSILMYFIKLSNNILE